MKKKHILLGMVFALCLICAGALCVPQTASAKGITKASQAKKLAKKQVKGATSIKVKKERDNGVLVYQVELVKGKKEYELAYRASDGKLISQSWELRKAYVKKGSGKLIGLKKCKSLAKKQVSNGKIVKAVKKRSKGIDLYDIKMQKSNKKYELKYHARTGKLLEYEWELISKNTSSNTKEKYISEEQAKQAALETAGGGSVVKIKFTTDDGIKVYEIDIINGNYEYEITVHAETGKILDVDKERIHSANPGESTEPGQDAIISQEEASAIALEAAGGGSVVKIKLDTDDGVKVYEVDVINGNFEYEIEILASTGDILKTEKKTIKPSTSDNPGQTQPNPGQTQPDGKQLIGLDAAKQISIADVGLDAAEVSFQKAKLDYEDGMAIYEIEFYTDTYEYEYEINAYTGEIYNKEQKKIAGASENQPGNTESKISIEDAKSIAASHAGLSASDVRFKKAKLDWEDGRAVYEIEFYQNGMEYEYEIDAITGKILDYEWDLDD
ncbi:MAG: hypothetical protein HFH40_02925 [Lachnospiraceae bacterium]|nr:hypothetical protein [Lachnospiraceae bacterium]